MSNTRYPLLRPKLHPLLIRGEAALRQAMGLAYHFSQGETLISAGEESNAIFLLESGWITRTRVANSGLRQIISIFLPGDLIGIESILIGCQSDTVECLTSGQVRIIDREQLLELIAQNHAVSARAMFEIAEDNRRLRNWGTALGKGRADQRIAIFLIDLYRRLHRAGLVDGNKFWMPMRQLEVADHLGLSHEHL